MLDTTENTFDVKTVAQDFPILGREVYGKRLAYLDNGASAQKPLSVLKAIDEFYSSEYANVHRGLHFLSNTATERFEEARRTVQRFLNAESDDEIIFTKNATEAINLVAYGLGLDDIGAGDEIVLSIMEHHSNIVPWQMVCEEKGAVLNVIDVNDKGEFVMSSFEGLLSDKTKLVAVNHVSNPLGTVNPVKTIIQKAHEVGAVVCVDGAQAAPHMKIDVQDLDADFYSISGHKMYGPTGIGVLYGKEKLLNDAPPWRGGGEMIASVSFESTTYNVLPHKFEAGTPHVEGAVGLAAAVRWMETVGVRTIHDHENELLDYATGLLSAIDGLRIYGTSTNKASVISFLVDDIHPYDIGTLLDKLGIAVRTGHHCTEPLMTLFNIPGTVRASFAVYNTKEEVDVFVEALKRVLKMLR